MDCTGRSSLYCICVYRSRADRSPRPSCQTRDLANSHVPLSSYSTLLLLPKLNFPAV